MLTGFSKHLIASADAKGIAVGFTSGFAEIDEINNSGTSVKAPSGKSYTMPKRQFLGLSKELEQQIMNEISNHYKK